MANTSFNKKTGFTYTPYQLEKDVKSKSTSSTKKTTSTSSMPTLQEASAALGQSSMINSNKGLSPSEQLKKIEQETGIKAYNGSSSNSSNSSNNTLNNLVASVPQLVQSSGGSYLSGGGSSTPAYNEAQPIEADFKIDLASMLAAFDEAANTSRTAAENAYNTTRSDLAKALTRYQEEHAKNVENQRRAYLSNQASLEDARAELNRSTRINAAARGLAGSGLQQLAQLQNLMNQSQDISDLALENQNVMENLRTVLARAEEDHASDLAKAETARNEALQSIASTLGTNKANLEYNAAQTAKNQYLNALESWKNRQFQASENAKSRALTESQMRQEAADKQASAETAYNNTLSSLKAALNTLKGESDSRTLASIAKSANIDTTSTAIDKMTKAQKASLVNEIANNYALSTDTALSTLDDYYALPLENSNKNKQTVNDILATYGYSKYYQ